MAEGLGLLWVQVSEAFLQRVMALYTAAHYKNQVNAPLPLYQGTALVCTQSSEGCLNLMSH